MAKNPKFSIIVPVYNVEKYLMFCIESLISQTLKDIEIICVNDGSTDKSLKVLEEYSKKDFRIKIINKENGGVSSARNEGIQFAEGEFVLFVDADDYLDRRACDRLYMEILQENPDMIVFGTNIFPRTVYSEHIEWLRYVLAVETKKYDNNSVLSLFNEKSSKPFVWNKCYRREVLENNKIFFDPNLSLGEDMLFLFDVFPVVDKIIYLEDKLYNYRCDRENSLIKKGLKNPEWQIGIHLVIIKKVLESWSKNRYIDNTKDELYYWCLEFIINDLIKAHMSDELKKEKAQELQEIINIYGLEYSEKGKDIIDLEIKLKCLMQERRRDG